MGCEACIYSAQEQHRQYNAVKKNAKEYAQTKNTQVVIYQNGIEWAFTTLEDATERCIPYREVLSQH